MADTKDPFRQLVETAVYAPIGLMLLARRELPALTEAGRSRVESQVALARLVARLAVSRGSQELKRRLDAAEAARRGGTAVVDAESTEMPSPSEVDTLPEVIIAAVAQAERDTEPAPTSGARPRGAAAAFSAAAAAAATANGDPATAADVATLPIEGYDSLAASQVVVRLSTLTPDELTVIHDHELAHRNRRTILGKISQLQAR